MTAFIDEHRDEHGVEPICRELQVAPCTYYAATSLQPSARARSDAELKPKIVAFHEASYGVYGAHK